MAIDADLNAGVLTNEEARERRAEISREADFYGAMDGASKFVKGDAIAGILILAINIIGGLIIGIGEKVFEIYWGGLMGGGVESWFAFIIALIFLLFRPQGLFGDKIIERV